MIFKKIKNNPKLFGYIKTFSIIIVSFIALLYAAFLFILPNAININNFTPQINEQVEKISGFKLALDNPKLKTTWNLGVKVQADNISLKYDDDTDFINLLSPSLELNLPTLIFGHLNLDKIFVKEAQMKLVFTKNKNYTLEKYILNTLNNLPEPKEEEKKNNFALELRNINIIASKIILSLWDENISKNYILEANDSQVSLSTLKGPLKVKTTGYIKREGLDENFADFNINFQTKLPQIAQDNETQNQALSDFKFNFNPFEGIDLFSLRSKIDVDLKISDPSENFNAKGYANIDKISIKINGKQLPDSSIHTNFDKNKIKTQSKIYISDDEYISTNNLFSAGKKSSIDLNIKTDKLNLANIKTLSQSVLNMFNIKNSLSQISTSGEINCDFNLQSNFKTVKSQGKLELKNGVVKYPSANVVLDKITSYLDFSDNKINIKNTGAYLNGSKFALSGTIDTKTNLDLKVKSDPLKISDIIKLATGLGLIKEKDIKDYSFRAGTVNILLDIKGDLKNIIPVANIELNNLSLLIKSLNAPITLTKAAIVAKIDEKNKKDFIANIDAHNFSANLKNPIFNISAPKCTLEANSKDITITPFALNLHGSTTTISGAIKDYTTKPDISVKINGKINPETILTFVPSQNKKYVTRAGQMPFEVTVNGKPDNIKILADVTSNPQNYISVVEIKNIKGQQNKLSADINLKGDTLLINSVGIANIASVNGKINNIYAKTPTLSPINIVTKDKLSLNLPIMGKLSLDGSCNVALNGNMYSPQITGSADISNLNWQDYKTTVSSAYLEFKKSIINARAQGIKVAGSDFSGTAEISSNLAKTTTINNLDFSSSYIDSDALIKLMSSMPNTQTTAGPSVPLTIKKGTGKITKLKSGNISAENISFNFTLNNNLVKLTNIAATFADGKITADADYNIANTKVNVDGTGKNINARKAANCFVGGSSIIMSGTANGIAKLNFRGNTYEQQMRSLNGQVIFDIANGQYGEAARFERFLHAGNLLSQSLLNLNLNHTISAVTSKNTGEFKKIEGKISLANGWANITSLESSGPNMSLYITGKYNLLTQNADLKVLGRISSTVVSVLGPLGSFSLDKLVDKLPQTGIAIIDTIKSVVPQSPLFADINQKDLAKIPQLSVTSYNATSKDFQVLINGNVSKTTSIKSFKWANKETQN